MIELLYGKKCFTQTNTWPTQLTNDDPTNQDCVKTFDQLIYRKDSSCSVSTLTKISMQLLKTWFTLSEITFSYFFFKLRKRDFRTDASLWNFEILKNIFFVEHFRWLLLSVPKIIFFWTSQWYKLNSLKAHSKVWDNFWHLKAF